MGTRKQRQRQEELWYRRDRAEAPGHPFYQRLNEVLDQAIFDGFCEARCRKVCHEKLGRPSLAGGGGGQANAKSRRRSTLIGSGSVAVEASIC